MIMIIKLIVITIIMIIINDININNIYISLCGLLCEITHIYIYYLFRLFPQKWICNGICANFLIPAQLTPWLWVSVKPRRVLICFNHQS